MSVKKTDISIDYDFSVQEYDDKSMEEIQAIVDAFNNKEKFKEE